MSLENFIGKKEEIIKKVSEIDSKKEGNELNKEINDVIHSFKKEGNLTYKEILDGFKSVNGRMCSVDNPNVKAQSMQKIIIESLLTKQEKNFFEASQDDIVKSRILSESVKNKLKSIGFDFGAHGIMRFQKRMGLTPDGLIGPLTIGALVKELETRSSANIKPSLSALRKSPTPDVSIEKPTADSDILAKINDTLKIKDVARGGKIFENLKAVSELKKQLESRFTLKDLGIEVVESKNKDTGKPLKEWKISGTNLTNKQIRNWMDKVDGVHKDANQETISQEISIKFNNPDTLQFGFDRGLFDTKYTSFTPEELSKVFDKDLKLKNLKLKKEEYKKLLQTKLVAEIIAEAA